MKYMKTLKQAFEEWAKDKRFAVLAAKSRTAFTRVYLGLYGIQDVSMFTEEYTRNCILNSRESKENKVKATSALIHILGWLSEKGEAVKPGFTYGIATDDVLPARVTKQSQEAPVAKVRGGARQPRPVAEINPVTLVVIERFPSVAAATRKYGFANLAQNCRGHYPRNGRYFAYLDELKGWKPKGGQSKRRDSRIEENINNTTNCQSL